MVKISWRKKAFIKILFLNIINKILLFGKRTITLLVWGKFLSWDVQIVDLTYSLTKI